MSQLYRGAQPCYSNLTAGAGDVWWTELERGDNIIVAFHPGQARSLSDLEPPCTPGGSSHKTSRSQLTQQQQTSVRSKYLQTFPLNILNLLFRKNNFLVTARVSFILISDDRGSRSRSRDSL